MKHVHLLRHAKSSWKDPALNDRDRPLAGRGRRAAKAMAGHVRDRSLDPDLVICSPARRARETLERIETVLGQGAVQVEPRLYESGAEGLLDVLRELPDKVDSVLLIGHNPSLQELALALAARSSERERVEAKLPTGALVTLAIPVARWREVESGGAELEAFVRPRDLT
jgi:phosphohistidine phosphatase